MNNSNNNKDNIKAASAAAQVVDVSEDEIAENVLLDCLDPVNKTVANKTEQYVNNKLNVNESWGLARCCLYTTTISSIMLVVGYLLVVVFESFIAINGKLAPNQLTFLNYSVKAIAVIAFVLIAKAYARMSDKALGYSGFIFAFALFLLFSQMNSFEEAFM